jgi:hypothetical protein
MAHNGGDMAKKRGCCLDGGTAEGHSMFDSGWKKNLPLLRGELRLVRVVMMRSQLI